jgi:DNA-binding response OmpR family regulator
MQLIMPLIALRKEMLILEKRRINSALRKSASQLQGVVNHFVFRDSAKKSPESRINDFEVDVLDRKIGMALHLLEKIHIAPYLQQAEQARLCILNKAKKYFRSRKQLINNLGPAREALAEAVKILESNVENFG